MWARLKRLIHPDPNPNPDNPDPRCRKNFSDLGPEYRCIRDHGHNGWHIDQHENQWNP